MTDSIDVKLFDPATLVDPYPAYKILRDRAPVYFVPEMNLHVVTRYELVREAIQDTETFSSAFDEFLVGVQRAGFAAAPPEIRAQLSEIHGELIPPVPTLLTLDEPRHTHYRALVRQLFTAGQVRKTEPQVAAIVERAADEYAAQPGSDFVAGFAAPVPLRIIADRLGIPGADRALFDEAAVAAAAALRMTPMTPAEMLRRAQLSLDLQRLLVRLIEERRRTPQGDMISILATSRLEDGDRPLTHAEALSILAQFLVAGHETTASTFAFGMLLLCRHPEVQRELRESPERIKAFAEEVLRLESPVQGLPRVVARDTELGGVPLRAGDRVMLRFGAANRDERQFENPDRIDLQRPQAGSHFAFGSGRHHCIGAPLARQELNLGFAALLERMHAIRLAPGAPEPQAEASFVLRNLPSLHLAFEVAA